MPPKNSKKNANHGKAASPEPASPPKAMKSLKVEQLTPCHNNQAEHICGFFTTLLPSNRYSPETQMQICRSSAVTLARNMGVTGASEHVVTLDPEKLCKFIGSILKTRVPGWADHHDLTYEGTNAMGESHRLIDFLRAATDIARGENFNWAKSVERHEEPQGSTPPPAPKAARAAPPTPPKPRVKVEEAESIASDKQKRGPGRPPGSANKNTSKPAEKQATKKPIPADDEDDEDEDVDDDDDMAWDDDDSEPGDAEEEEDDYPLLQPLILLDGKNWPKLYREAWMDVKRQLMDTYSSACRLYTHDTNFILDMMSALFNIMVSIRRFFPKPLPHLVRGIDRAIARLEYFNKKSSDPKAGAKASELEANILQRDLPSHLKNARRKVDRTKGF